MENSQEAKRIVENIRKEIEVSKGTHIWVDYLNALKLISQVVFTRSAGFILELIQNAEDAGLGLKDTGVFEIRINKDRVKVTHNGRPFSENDVRALCGIRSSKKPEQGTLGYLGIGFKSVFKVTDCPEIYSGGFQFKFDRNYKEWGDPSNTPWHVLPIWIDQPSEVIDQDKTTFVIPFREEASYLSSLREAEKLGTELYLFLRWLKRIEVVNEFSKETSVEWTQKGIGDVMMKVCRESWVLENMGDNEEGIAILRYSRYGYTSGRSGYTYLYSNYWGGYIQQDLPIPLNLTQDGTRKVEVLSRDQRFKFFRRTIEVPDWVKQDRLTQEYRANVVQREIAIAFALDERGNLAPSEARAMYGGVYSFLPLGETRSGVKFPIQADFLVQPGREAINCEAKWNHWLVEQVANLCKEAIDCFKKDEKWKYQFLPAFEFVNSEYLESLESYNRLFRPKLIEPLEKFLKEDNCIPTADGGWAKPGQVVKFLEDQKASEELVNMGILKEDEIPVVLGGQPGMKLVAPNVKEWNTRRFKKVDRRNLLQNKAFLEEKCRESDAVDWFRSLYSWLQKNPIYIIRHRGVLYRVSQRDYEMDWQYRDGRSYKRQGREYYHDYEFILTADMRLHKGDKVTLLDIPINKNLTDDLQSSEPTLHPGILTGATNKEEQEALRRFLTGFTGVQVLDNKTVCKKVLLPKIVAYISPNILPKPDDLLRYTIYCQQFLQKWEIEKEIGGDWVLWVLTKQGDVKTANKVFFPKEFKPEQDWETHQQYVPGLSFISPRYIDGITDDDKLKAWRQFFRDGGVRDTPYNAVEDFAMNYAEEKLKASCKSITFVDNRNFGYDIEAEKQSGERMYIEVKGLSQDRDISLTDNERKAAQIHKESYYLCVVSPIPENPTMYMLQNPADAEKETRWVTSVAIPIKAWKTTKWL